MTIKDIISLLPAKKEYRDGMNTTENYERNIYPQAIEACNSALSKRTDKESEYRVALEKIEADVSWGDHHDRAEYESQLRKIWDIASKALKVTKEECI